MQSDIFGEWFKYTNSEFRVQNWKVLLFIDNASSHFNPDKNNTEQDDNLNLLHIRVHFLPLI